MTDHKIGYHGYEPEEVALARIIRKNMDNKVQRDAYRNTLKRYIENRLGGVPVMVPEYYGYVLFAGVASGVFMAWQSFMVWRSRYLNDVPDEALYYPQNEDFSCKLRAYISTCEIYPHFLYCLAVGGMDKPRFCAFCGFVWIFGRYMYARAYYRGKPTHRQNGNFYLAGQLGIYLAMISFAAKRMAPWTLRKTKYRFY